MIEPEQISYIATEPVMPSVSLTNPEVGISVELTDDQFQWMYDIAKEYEPKSVGGYLLGAYDVEKNAIHVMVVMPPPPDSEFGSFPSPFVRGIEEVQDTVNQFWRDSEEHVYYIGEWYSRPNTNPTVMTPELLKSMQGIAADSRTECHSPLLLLLGGDLKNKPVLSAIVFRKDDIVLVGVAAVTIKKSPGLIDAIKNWYARYQTWRNGLFTK
jgi:hypothetical protein